MNRNYSVIEGCVNEECKYFYLKDSEHCKSVYYDKCDNKILEKYIYRFCCNMKCENICSIVDDRCLMCIDVNKCNKFYNYSVELIYV